MTITGTVALLGNPSAGKTTIFDQLAEENQTSWQLG
ncbi:Fe2+ transport system protein B [secondary endosymbiont of Heteropsylla cubana]|uniref:Fe2+ transport system protein B n=1 Tax=secondary endosymbiont of Heteropsylla cubana TaxID=134287 RepID=J3TGG2_9ENTR|nr:FeoB small GTPase domain-containing protein [secondary endosymbiont of Heteropsylla cubana]AFP85517.1 Fe2+ transport system protein B [secondary endosymbiont of Heteropsylla cubana]